jgi:hypothetical protein
LTGKPEGKGPLDNTWRRWKDNISVLFLGLHNYRCYVNCLDYTVLNGSGGGEITDKVGMMWKESVIDYLKVLSQTFPTGLKKKPQSEQLVSSRSI